MKWIAFFSQTGSEIVKLSKELGRKPDLLVTNNFEEKIKFNPGVRGLNVTIQTARHEGLMTYFSNQKLYSPEDTIITLHGYLRILPKSICNTYTIYNGHPALINWYPELKGKDPQIRTWEGKYPVIGSVVHKVTPGVDEGEIVSVFYCDNNCSTLEELYGTLKNLSLQSWLIYLKDIV